MGASTRRRFELAVEPLQGEAYALALREARPKGQPAEGAGMILRVAGDPLRVVMDHVLASLRQAGQRPSDLRRTRREPFLLDEEDGVRLGLLFLALRPMRKIARMDAIAAHVRAMPPEELLYWYSLMSSGEAAPRARRALRILLAEN